MLLHMHCMIGHVRRPCISYRVMRPKNFCDIFIIFYTFDIKDPEGFGKKLKENCRSDHYSGQSSNTKESCSSTPLNCCTGMEMRWNKKAVSLVAGVMTNIVGQTIRTISTFY